MQAGGSAVRPVDEVVGVGPVGGSVAAGPGAAAVADGERFADADGHGALGGADVQHLAVLAEYDGDELGVAQQGAGARVRAALSRVPLASLALAVRFWMSAQVRNTVMCGRRPPWPPRVPSSRRRRRASVRACARRVPAGRGSAAPPAVAGWGAARWSMARRSTSIDRSSSLPVIGVSPVLVLRVPMVNSVLPAGSRSSRVPSGSNAVARCCAATSKCCGSMVPAICSNCCSACSRTSGGTAAGRCLRVAVMVRAWSRLMAPSRNAWPMAGRAGSTLSPVGRTCGRICRPSRTLVVASPGGSRAGPAAGRRCRWRRGGWRCRVGRSRRRRRPGRRPSGCPGFAGCGPGRVVRRRTVASWRRRPVGSSRRTPRRAGCSPAARR